MKILTSAKERRELINIPLSIPDRILNENQARINHGQSLERLNARGGLGACEAVAIAENRRWHRMEPQKAIDKLNEIVDQANND